MDGWVGGCYTRLLDTTFRVGSLLQLVTQGVGTSPAHNGTMLSGPGRALAHFYEPSKTGLLQALPQCRGWLSLVSTNHSILCGYPGHDVVQE